MDLLRRRLVNFLFPSKPDFYEGVVAPWCNPLTLQPEQPGEMGSSPGRAPPLKRHNKGRGFDLVCSTSAIPALGADKRNFTFTISIKS